MAKIIYVCLSSLAVALLFVQGGEGIWCFQCNSRTDENCTHIETNDTMSIYYRECDEFTKYEGKEVFCRKIEQKIHDLNGMIRVVRGCGWLKHPTQDCYKLSNVGHSEEVCQCFTDACNKATAQQQTHLNTILCLAIALVTPYFLLQYLD